MARIASRLKSTTTQHDPLADFERNRQTAEQLYLQRRGVMLDVHQHINVISGQMVTAYANVSEAQISGWSARLRMLADQLDGLTPR